MTTSSQLRRPASAAGEVCVLLEYDPPEGPPGVEIEVCGHIRETWEGYGGDRDGNREGWERQVEISQVEMAYVLVDEPVPDEVYSALEPEALEALEERWHEERQQGRIDNLASSF